MAKVRLKQTTTQEESESAGDSDGGSSDSGRDSSLEGGDESSAEEEGQGRDGMADMMSKILHQQVDGGRIPVLAKRKTTIMKQLEQEKASHDRLKEARRQKREDKGKFMVVPDHSTGDYERQLRKVATRGVVALFNAITKAKREELEKDESEPKTAPKSKAAEVGALSRVNFVGLLQKEAAKATASTSSTTKSRESSVPTESAGESHHDDDLDDSASSKKKKKSGWSALEDGLLVDRKLALKDWDQDDDSEGDSEDDARGKPNPNSKLEDPFRELSERAAASDKGGKKGAKRSKKRPAEDSSDDDGDYKKQYPKKRSASRKK
mmetsp:Transcript_6798/g.13071  ORF Transcript_6798/g.13071 Transcript_6798/m.13071 type:complete len:322 (+) Transcript_6798:42-1007(+)